MGATARLDATQKGLQSPRQRYASLSGSVRRVHAGLYLLHLCLRPVTSLAQSDPVAAIYLDPHRPDVTPVPTHVALNDIGARCLVAYDHQAFDLLIPVDAGGERQVPDAGFGEIAYDQATFLFKHSAEHRTAAIPHCRRQTPND